MQNVISMLSSSTLPLHVGELVWVVKRGGSLSFVAQNLRNKQELPVLLAQGS
jgi:hypothetical protein